MKSPPYRAQFLAYVLAMMADNVEHVISYWVVFQKFHSPALAGFAVMMHLAASNTVLQTVVDEYKRGRIMSLYAMAFLGMAPFGSVLAGALADRFGAPTMVAISGGCCIAGSVLFALNLGAIRAKVRPVYVQKGILPEVAVGLQSASQLMAPPERQ